MLDIVQVRPGSLAERLGLEPGDTVLSVNGEKVNDLIDFKFLTAEEVIILAVKKRSGSTVCLKLLKTPDADPGLEFPLFPIKRCRNRCIFCFVDQMPPGCRKSLYVKDDDFRASFLYGNYITLCSLTDSDRGRIFRQRLSPLYISVHTTDPDLRSRMLGNQNAPDIMAELRRLAAGGIRIHAQIVLCPGINDGKRLTKTLEDLAGLAPAVSSIAVVPVGLTSHRKGLSPLKPFTRAQARAVLKTVAALGKSYKRKFGTRLVFAADEFFIKAGEPVPPAVFYEDFPQIENGVGMVADFMRKASSTRLPSRIAPLQATLVTGASFGPTLKSLLRRFGTIEGLTVRPVIVPNRFFGPSVTVAGLLTGGDILSALRGKKLGDLVVIPSNALKEDEDVFLDGMSLAELQKALIVPVQRADTLVEVLDAVRSKTSEGEKP